MPFCVLFKEVEAVFQQQRGTGAICDEKSRQGNSAIHSFSLRYSVSLLKFSKLLVIIRVNGGEFFRATDCIEELIRTERYQGLFIFALQLTTKPPNPSRKEIMK
jgi:hypothetical protein